MENAIHGWIHTLKDAWHFGRQMSHLSVQTKTWDGFFKPALLRSKTNTTSESSVDELIVLYFYRFLKLCIIIYFNCKWVFTRWQWYYNKTQHTNNTSHTTMKRNTACKTTHTINTLHRMNTTIQLQLYKLVLINISRLYTNFFYILIIWFVRLLALRPLLAYCASLGW
jgi:hypothetical protein